MEVFQDNVELQLYLDREKVSTSYLFQILN